MDQQPLVSVIIPAYNNAEYLGDAIGSVLQQTYSNIELVIVNDASPDNAAEVIKSFDDPRIKYINHDVNKGLSAARNTGIRAASGDLIALLDGDDFFHPEKLRLHVEFLEKNFDIGATYNARFDLTPSAKTINRIWRPPLKVGLKELISGYPFGPSDMVIRREWVLKINMFDESYVYVGEDLDFNCRLALAGCKFASVDRVLNFRRYYSSRVIKDIPYFVNNTFRAMNTAFADPRCPEEVLDLKDDAFANHYILWSAIAYIQNDIELGKDYCMAAVRLNPSLLDDRPPKIAEIFVNYAIFDDGGDHEKLLRTLFSNLPDELRSMFKLGEAWAIASGFLQKGIRAIMWGKLELGKKYFAQAVSHNARLTKPVLTRISYDLINYESEFGSESVARIIQYLTPFVNSVENPTKIKWSKGHYFLDHAYKFFDEGDYANCRSWIVRAVAYSPLYLKDRGVLRIFFLSLVRQISQMFFPISLNFPK